MNKERIQYYRDWREKNREKYNEYQKEWGEKHISYKRNLGVKYVFRKRFGGLRDIVIKRDKETCQLCGITRTEHKEKYGRDISVDHIDGNGRNSQNPNNSIENLRVLCLVCNLHASRERRKLKVEEVKI